MKRKISALLIIAMIINTVCSFNIATAAKIVPTTTGDGVPDVLVFGGTGFSGDEYGMTEYHSNKIITDSLDAPIATELSPEEYLVVNVAIKEIKDLRAFGITLEYDDELLIPMTADSESSVKPATASGASISTEELFFKTPEIATATGSLLKTRNHFIPGKTDADNGTISAEVISTDFAPADLTAIDKNYYAIGAFVFGYAANKSKEDLAEDSISIATDVSAITAHSGTTVPHALYLADSTCTLDYEYYSLEETGYNGVAQKDISLDFDISTYTSTPAPTSTPTPEPTLKPGDIGFTETFDGFTDDYSQKAEATSFNEATGLTLTATAYGSWPKFFANGTKVENGALTVTGEGNSLTSDYTQAGVTKVYNTGHLYYYLPEGFEAGTVTVDVTISAISGNRVQLFNVYTDNSNSGAMYTNTGDGKGNDDNLNLLATAGSDGNYHLRAVISRENTADNWSVTAIDTIGNVPLKAAQTLPGASLDGVRIVSATPGNTSGCTPSVTVDEIKVKVEYPEKADPKPTPEPTLKPGDIGFTETFDGFTDDYSQKEEATSFNEATGLTLTATAYGSWPKFFANGTKVENGALTITGEGNGTTEDYTQAGVTKVYNSGHLYYNLPEGFEAGTVTVDVTISEISGNRIQLFTSYGESTNSGAMYTHTGDGVGNDDNINLLATLGSDGKYHLKAVISRASAEDDWSVAAFDTIGNVPLKVAQALTSEYLDRIRIVSATPGTTNGCTPSVTIDEIKVRVEYPEKAAPTPTPAPIYYEGYENVVYDFGTAFDLPVYSKLVEEDIKTYTYDITESSLVSGDTFERELLRDTYVLNFLNDGFKTNVRLGQNMNAFYLYNETAGLWVEIVPSEYFHDVAHGEEVEDPGVYYLTVNIISNSFDSDTTPTPAPRLPYYEGYENVVYDFGAVFNLPVYSKLVEGDITTYTYDITESSLVIGDTFARTELRDAYVLNFLNHGFKTNVRLGQNMNAFYLYNETTGLWVEIIPSDYFHDVAHGEEVEDPGVYYLTVNIVQNTIDLGPTPTPSPTTDPSTDPASNANLKAISVSGISAIEVVPGKYTYTAEAASNYASHVIWATKSVSASKIETAVVASEEEVADAVYADNFRASFARLAEGETKIVLFRVTSSNGEFTNVYKVVITRPGATPTPTATPEPAATPAPTQTPTPAPAANANLKAISVSGISAVEVVPGKYTYTAEAASNYASHVIWATKSVSASKIETAVVASEEEVADAVYADNFRASFARLAEGETKIVLFRVTSSNGIVTNVYKVVITRPGATPTPTATPEPAATPAPTQTPTPAPAANANLKAISVSGISAIEVVPGKYTYTAEAASNYASHVIWATKSVSASKIETAVVASEEEVADAVYADNFRASFARLAEGETKIVLFRVTSSNGEFTNVYKVVITRPGATPTPTATPKPEATPEPTQVPTPAPASNANLKAFFVSGISAVEVAAGKYTYTAEAADNYAKHVIWVQKANSNAKVETAVVESEEEIADAVYADKSKASFDRLPEGATKIILFRVTSQNGTVTNVYKVVITNPSEEATPTPTPTATPGPAATPAPTQTPTPAPAANANLKAISVSGISAVEVVPGKYTYEAEAASNYASHVIWATKSVSASKIETAVVASEEEVAEAVYADNFRASFTRLAEGETKIVLFRVTSSNGTVTNVYKVVITRP